MNRTEIDKAECDEVTREDFEDALKSVLLAPRGKAKSANREPAKAELEMEAVAAQVRLRTLLRNSQKIRIGKRIANESYLVRNSVTLSNGMVG